MIKQELFVLLKHRTATGRAFIWWMPQAQGAKGKAQHFWILLEASLFCVTSDEKTRLTCCSRVATAQHTVSEADCTLPLQIDTLPTHGYTLLKYAHTIACVRYTPLPTCYPPPS